MRDVIHKSIILALITDNLEKELSKEISDQAKEKVKADLKRWSEEALSDVQIAVEIYSPLERKQASKAVVAQLFSRILLNSKVKKEEILNDPHLKYLVDAIKYVTNV